MESETCRTERCKMRKKKNQEGGKIVHYHQSFLMHSQEVCSWLFYQQIINTSENTIYKKNKRPIIINIDE